MKTTPRFSLRTIASLLVLGAFVPQFSHAADYTWLPSTGGTWDTTTANWNDGVTNPTTWINGSGNNAVFNALTGSPTITLSSSVSANSLSTNGGLTILFNGGQTMDITTINTAGGGNVGAIDMFNVLTGSHDLNYFGGGTGSSGRLNLKVANTYTGDTNLSGLAYLTLGAGTNVAYLPTTTTLNMGSTATTLRFGATNQSQEIAGLTSSGNSASIRAIGVTGNTLIINTESGVTTAYTGNISDSVSLEIKGSGTQAINAGGSKAYTGSTTISAGTLLLGTTLTNTSAVNVTGGTLRTSGANLTAATIADITMSSGTVDLNGEGSVGKLTIGSTKDFIATGGTIKFDLDTTATLDQIAGSGLGSNFSLTNTTIALNLITWTAPDYANTYTLFTGFADPGVVSGVTITGYDAVNYTASLSSAGVLSFTAVPEPSSVALIAVGGIALSFYRTRARRRQL